MNRLTCHTGNGNLNSEGNRADIREYRQQCASPSDGGSRNPIELQNSSQSGMQNPILIRVFAELINGQLDRDRQTGPHAKLSCDIPSASND